ncbi:MAG TPA: hypothetical protein PKW16_12055 [Treponemataceae bacterium]|nr:hypothetical protein [Treponemataceae bacterium]HOU39621.1 hypothetical protein [Treponemataceae bacterium]
MSGESVILQSPELLELLVSLVFGAAASFLAIMVWTKTASLAWILVVAGILASYAGLLYRTLRVFGFFSSNSIPVFATTLGSLLSANIPQVLFIAALIVFLFREK